MLAITMTTRTLVAMAWLAVVTMTTTEACDMQTKFEQSGIVVGGNVSMVTASRARNGGYDVTIDVFCVYKGEPTEPRITVHNVGMVESSSECDLKPSNALAKLSERPGPKFIYFEDTPDPSIKFIPNDHLNEYFDEINLACGINKPTKLPIGTQGSEIKCFERPEDDYYDGKCFNADGEEQDIVNYESEMEAKKTTPKPETPKPEPATSKPESKTDSPPAATPKVTEAQNKAATTAAPAAPTEKADKGYEIEDKEEDKQVQEPEAEVGATKDKNSGTTASLALATVLLAVLTALIL